MFKLTGHHEWEAWLKGKWNIQLIDKRKVARKKEGTIRCTYNGSYTIRRKRKIVNDR